MNENTPSHYRFLAVLLGIIALHLASSSPAATLTWDANGSAAPLGFDGSGSWTDADSWTNAGGNVTWTDGNAAVFGAGTNGTYGINVGSAILATTLSFKNSGYTLTNATPVTITLGSVANSLIIAGGTTTTIGTNVTVEVPGAGSQFFTIGGLTTGAAAAGTLNITNGATVRSTSGAGSVLIDGLGTVVNVWTGGTLTGSGASIMTVGTGSSASPGANCTLNIEGGAWSSTSALGSANLTIGQRGVGTVNLNSGTASCGAASLNGLIFGQIGAGSGGTFNLNGGTLSVPVIKKLVGTGVFNFNGGTLVALTNNSAFMTGLTSANVKSGGAVIDDGGFAITIGQALLAGTPSGGLTKLGAGTLTLTGANTYSGGTIISNGTVLASSLGTGNVDVKAGARLGAGSGNTVATLAIGGNLTLTNSMLLFDINGLLSADKITVTSNLTPDGVTTVLLPNVTPLANGDYTLVEVTNTLGGSAANFTVASQSPKTYSIIYQAGSPNRVVLHVTGPLASKSWAGDGVANQWDINTTSNWVETGGFAPLVYTNSDTVVFDNTATNLNVDIAVVVSPALVTVNSTNSFTFSGAGGIAGTNSLTKNGLGTNNSSALTLSTSNSYSGGTTLLGTGILILSNSAALGTGPMALQSSRVGAAATVFLMGGITVTNPITLDSTTGREAFWSTNGNNTLAGPITITGSGANAIYFQNNGSAGSRFTISNSITGASYNNTFSLRGQTNALGLISGTITLNGLFQLNGNANWTIASTGNIWTETRISAGVGGFTLGATDALATGAKLKWDTDTSGALDMAGYNQTLAGLEATTFSPAIGNSSTGSDSLLKVNGASLAFSGTLKDTLGAGTRKLSLELVSGNQTLRGTNTYSGPTTISGGTLTLATSGSIANSPVISVASGAAFNVSTVTGGFALGAAQTLIGNGTVVGPTTINGTLAPGVSGVGILTINNDLTLVGTTVMEIARNGAVLTNDLVEGINTLNYGGALIVTNVGGSALEVGDTFKLFAASTYNPSFGSVIYPGGYTFTDNLAVDGTVTVLTAPVIAPPTLNYAPSGGNWVFTWAVSGFKLQTQTNTRAIGLGTNWVDVAGGNTSGVSVPAPVTANPAVFFRLISTP